MAHVEIRGARGHVARAAAARLETLGHQLSAEGDGGAVDLLLDLRPPHERRRASWAHALQGGAHVVAASLDARDLAWAQDTWGPAAEQAGLVLLPTAGATACLGDWLGALASGAAGGAAELHTAHLVVERGGLRGNATPGLRAELAPLLQLPVAVRAEGVVVDEPLGERRRLAWFARPVGPHHAASVPAPEVHSLARHQRTAALIAGYLAMPGWRAEVLQGLGNLATWSPRSGRWLALRAARPGRAGKAVAAPRWASVAEADGPAGVARAWANGRDLQVLTGEVVALVAEHILRGTARGVPAPSEVVDPTRALDHLAQAADLRWSVVRPEGAVVSE